ncbi:MAG TPA: hypothetical protein VNC84_05010 [Gammaproteobacteria bacterium]|jgi:hypothetical protein|nr:hypothetical protein [Gammaproteobacteria bacterium]
MDNEFFSGVVREIIQCIQPYLDPYFVGSERVFDELMLDAMIQRERILIKQLKKECDEGSFSFQSWMSRTQDFISERQYSLILEFAQLAHRLMFDKKQVFSADYLMRLYEAIPDEHPCYEEAQFGVRSVRELKVFLYEEKMPAKPVKANSEERMMQEIELLKAARAEDRATIDALKQEVAEIKAALAAAKNTSMDESAQSSRLFTR